MDELRVRAAVAIAIQLGVLQDFCEICVFLYVVCLVGTSPLGKEWWQCRR